MNSDKRSNPEKRKSRGNALVYVLLALALLGALTMLLSEQANESDSLGYEKTQLMTTKVVAYVASAKQVVDQMMMTGTTMDNIDYTRPGEPTFDDAPYIHKIYHPDGGGLNYFIPTSPPFANVADPYGPAWFFNTINVAWTPSAQTDLVLTAYIIDEQICRNINKEITGEEDIPVLTTNSLMHEFLPYNIWGGGSNIDLDETVCAECEGYPSMCVSNGFAPTPSFGYYNIIVAR